MKHIKKDCAKKIIVVIMLLFITFILSMKSGYNLFLKGGHVATDGDVFRCIGWLMTRGYVPYKDIFDHKGLILYFIEYIATFFGRVRGIWPVEVAFLAGTVFICYFFARKFNNRFLSIIIVLLMFVRWSDCGYGNCAEEFSLLFQIISIYFFVDFFLRSDVWLLEGNSHHQAGELGINKGIYKIFYNKRFDIRVFIVGICFACTFFMKANLCAAWVVFCPAVFIKCIRIKNWSALKRFCISFFIGGGNYVFRNFLSDKE